MTEIRTRQRAASSLSDSDVSCADAESASLLPVNCAINSTDRVTPPHDKFKVVYIIFYLLGVGTLLPWNMFITAKGYFIYQLRNSTMPASEYQEAQTTLQLSYESAIAVSNMVPNLLLQVANTSLAGRVSINKRIVGSLVVMILTFLVTLIFTKLNVVAWQSGFYAVTIITVILSSAASALLSSSLFGLAARFPQQHIQAVMGGMGLGGVFSAVAELIVLSVGSSVTASAFWYFFLAVLVLILAILSYFLLLNLDYAKHYQGQDEVMIIVERPVSTAKGFFSQYLKILRLIWPYALSVVLVFFVTLAMFPSITSEVQSVNHGSSNWTDKYFIPLYCFLLFNCGDLAGRMSAAYFSLPKPRISILFLSIIRLVFIPLFIMCNAQPRNNLPVWFNSDVYPIIIMVVFSLSNGYLSTLALMHAPALVSKQQSELTGSLMALSMTVGLSLGSAVSYGFVILVKTM
ncbi:equilibrative nucleoside transporter 3-like [Watersipora subatra]|uniref:equilibrative nucleoside transporter 3-like n=1 Tax=Watersipora subatra TaxID=2589382 RepID=UPI00355BB7A8